MSFGLEGKYYRIAACRIDGDSAEFDVVLLADYEVYKGHFPGNPVCPAVCHIGMLRECVAKLVKRDLFVSSVKKCRLTAMATPESCPCLKLSVELYEAARGLEVHARLYDSERTYMVYAGEMAFACETLQL